MNCNISRILSPRFRGGDHLSKRPEPGTDNAAGSGIVPYLALLRKGLAMRPGLLRSPVVSYTAVSPLPSVRKRPAVCSLLRCPSRGVAPAASLLKRDFPPCGVRTFLFARQSGRRCNSHSYYITHPRKCKRVCAFSRRECGGLRPVPPGSRRGFFAFFSFPRLQSFLLHDTLYKNETTM